MTFTSIAQQKYIESEDRFKSNDEFYLKSVDEMNKLFHDMPYALENSVIFSKKVLILFGGKTTFFT